jgi:hypothetical protein
MKNRLRIGNYIEKELKKKKIKKVDLYENIKKTFHKKDDYVEYKGFASRFYDNSNFYAQDLFEISYLLDIDLNDMRNQLINKRFNPELSQIKDALANSLFRKDIGDKYSYRYFIEDDLIYIVWFKVLDNHGINAYIEVYNTKKEKSENISYVSDLIAKKSSDNWDDLSFDDKIVCIKEVNKKIHRLENGEINSEVLELV